MERLPVSGPSITEKEVEYVADAVRTAWYGNANVYHDRFERAFAAYLGVKHAIALPSCTSAIHLSLLALGVGPGDEVVIPDATWIASAAPISYVGATPVFADVERDSWCLSAASFEDCVTPRTKAVIPVDLYGCMPDMHRIRDVAARHGVAIVEDAAEAIGSEYSGRKAGSFGDTGVFSFHGSKTLTTGEGGMLVTDRDDLKDRILFQRDHGRAPGPKLFWNTAVAHKYKMSSMQAALGLAQLERIDELVARKRRVFEWYRGGLAGLPGVTLNAEPPGVKSTFWMVTAILDPSLGLPKEDVIAALGQQAIDARPFFYPLSSLPAYEGTEQARAARARNRISYELSPTGVNLPCGLNMDEARVQRVCMALRELVAGRTRAAG